MFSPQLVDFDGDGAMYVISGSYAPGDLYLFKKRTDGLYARGKRLRDKDGKVLSPGAGSSAFAIDFDNDGDLDLIAGTMSGDVFIIPNFGTKQQAAFGPPERLLADGKPVHVDSNAAPIFGDWDGDGLPDLLIGTGSGSVILYRASGRDTGGRLVLSAPRTLLPASTLGQGEDPEGQIRERPWGSSLHVTLADFNGDGRTDLIVGDRNVELIAMPGLTTEQEKQRLGAERDFRDAERAYTAAVAEVMASLTKTSGDTAGCDFSKDPRVVAARAKKEAAQEKRVSFYSAYKEHGYVWVFLRKKA